MTGLAPEAQPTFEVRGRNRLGMRASLVLAAILIPYIVAMAASGVAFEPLGWFFIAVLMFFVIGFISITLVAGAELTVSFGEKGIRTSRRGRPMGFWPYDCVKELTLRPSRSFSLSTVGTLDPKETYISLRLPEPDMERVVAQYGGTIPMSTEPARVIRLADWVFGLTLLGFALIFLILTPIALFLTEDPTDAWSIMPSTTLVGFIALAFGRMRIARD